MIADKLADAQEQLTAAETAKDDAQKALDAIDSQTTLADVAAQEQVATGAVSDADTAGKAADQDLADAKAQASGDLAEDQAAAQTAVDNTIDNIKNQIADINDDIAELTDIAAKNPADTEIADKLADAKEQLETAQDALTDATSQKSVIEVTQQLRQLKHQHKM